MDSKPKLIVFDLDYTLWPYWCDTHIRAPFKMASNGTVKDNDGQTVRHYPEVPQVLERLQSQGYVLAVASRTGETRGANQLIQLFGWDKYFTYRQIYPGCKITHFKKLHKLSGFEFREMLFFDDERRNQYDVNKIGVLMYLIDDSVGVTQAVINKGLQLFAARAASK